MNTSVEKILHEVKKVIAGKDDVLEKIMMTVLSRGHVLLDDVPGTGKTTTALAFSRALGLQYGRIQFTPDVLPSDMSRRRRTMSSRPVPCGCTTRNPPRTPAPSWA